MFDFERPNIEVAEISEDKKYGRFVVEPLIMLNLYVNHWKEDMELQLVIL